MNWEYFKQLDHGDWIKQRVFLVLSPYWLVIIKFNQNRTDNFVSNYGIFKIHNLLRRNFSQTLELSRLVFSIVHTQDTHNQTDHCEKNGGQYSSREEATTAFRDKRCWISPKLSYAYVAVREILATKRTYFCIVYAPLFFFDTRVTF
jgi:hypothetical protein